MIFIMHRSLENHACCFFFCVCSLNRSNVRFSKAQIVFRQQKPWSCFTKTICLPQTEASVVFTKTHCLFSTEAIVVFHTDKCRASQRRYVLHQQKQLSSFTRTHCLPSTAVVVFQKDTWSSFNRSNCRVSQRRYVFLQQKVRFVCLVLFVIVFCWC